MGVKAQAITFTDTLIDALVRQDAVRAFADTEVERLRLYGKPGKGGIGWAFYYSHGLGSDKQQIRVGKPGPGGVDGARARALEVATAHDAGESLDRYKTRHKRRRSILSLKSSPLLDPKPELTPESDRDAAHRAFLGLPDGPLGDLAMHLRHVPLDVVLEALVLVVRGYRGGAALETADDMGDPT